MGQVVPAAEATINRLLDGGGGAEAGEAWDLDLGRDRFKEREEAQQVRFP